MINLYDSKTTKDNFNNNGLIVLSDCISCNITEELNGQYELEIEYPLDEYGKWKNLLEHNIIKADGQLFRIYRKIKTLKGIKINAKHIFYDLVDNLLEDVRPTGINGIGALDWILTRTQYQHPFTSTSDVQTVATRYFIRKSVVEAIMGTDGVINTWGGELVRDNFNIELLGARGLDRGVLVAYGKNIQGIEETLDIDGIGTRLMPKGNNELLLPEKYIDSQYINNYPHPKIKIIEFNDIGVDETNGITLEMAIVQLRKACNEYLLTSKCDVPNFNYKIDFLELSKTEEYKNYAVLERVYLGDTVTIKHSKLNINLKAKVIKITKNILTDRIEKIELGSFKPNLATSINNAIQEIKKEVVQVKSDYQKAIDNATQLITGSKGGNVVIRQNEAGKPTEILIMDTDNINTAKNVWRWNLGGFGHSSTGVNGPYDTAITQDGSIIGKFITALEISGEQITAGIIKSKNGKTLINMENGNAKFISNDGSYTEICPEQTGLKWHQSEADGGKDYHYLSYSGKATIQTSSGLWDNTIIQLPNEFKGKQFVVQVSLSKFDLPAFHMLANVGVDAWPEDYTNGTIKIMSSLQCYPVNPVFGSVKTMDDKEQFGWFLDSDLVPTGAGSVTVRFTVVA